jgi:hypothetical protein
MADTKQHAPLKPQAAARARRPDDYDRDLHPDTMAGQNIGTAGQHPEKHARTAHDIKVLHARYRDWADSDLKQIPVVPDGSRLEQSATYIDLAASEPREFTATGAIQAESGRWYVPKSEVPYELWNRLLGVKNVTRTGVAPP